MNPAGERDDQCGREVRRTWDAGVRESLGRLDELVAQTDEAVRLTRVLVDRSRRATL